jgi:shikimate kinase
MQEVFAKGGELLLRETEIALAKEYAAKKELVISTGGGVILNKIIIDYFKQSDAHIIYLEATFETIGERLKHDTSRPLFGQDAYDQRLPLYRRYADIYVDTNSASPQDIALHIRSKIYGI